MKKLFAILIVVCMLISSMAFAENRVVDLTADHDAEWAFEDGKDILEIYFPAIHGSDCCILRMGDQVMMIDCSTDDQAKTIVTDALNEMHVDHIDVAVNSHPHDDHLMGFSYLPENITIDTLYIGFPQNYNNTMKKTLGRFKEQQRVGKIEQLGEGDFLNFADVVDFAVMQHSGPEYTTNDRSLVLQLRYGECRMLFMGDVEVRGQKALAKYEDEEHLKADIIKYPHHGHSTIDNRLYEMIDPEIAIVTAHELPAKNAYAYMKKQGLPALSTWYGMITVRTDGNIWVIDREKEAR